MARAILDADITALSGRQGGVVYTHRASGTYVRPFTPPSNPRTAAQQAQRARMTATVQAWKQLTPAQAALWEGWAQAHPRRNRLTGEPYASSAFNAFASLTLRWLQINETGTPPQEPPGETFTPDVITVTAAADAQGIVWQASDANRAGVVTELRAQSLDRVNVKMDWNSAETLLFTAFGGPNDRISTLLPPGLYVLGYCFVERDTGQASSPGELGRVWVAGD